MYNKQQGNCEEFAAGFKPPVASATDRAKAVLPYLPWLSVCDVHVCILLVLHEPFVLNMYFSLYLLFTFEFLH